MSKTKSKAPAAGAPKSKSNKATDPLSSVKSGGVTKASQSVKAKSKELAKKVATVADGDKKSKKKAKKEPTPEPESDSDEEMDSSSSSGSESESEVETKKPTPKVNGSAKAVDEDDESESDSSESEESSVETTKPSKAAAKGDASSSETSDSGSDSDSDSGSDEESEEEHKKPAVKSATKPTAPNGVSKKAETSDTSESSSSSESESDDDEKPAVTKGVNGTKSDASSSDASSDEASDSEAESEGSEESSDEESEEETAPKKRKAEQDTETKSKKAKVEASATTEDGGSSNLFVGNLSWSIDEEWLGREFGEFGELSGVRIITDRDSGRSKGFGYVEFVNAADAAKAYKAKKDSELDGRTLNVDFAKPRDNTQQNGRDRANSRAQAFGDQPSQESATLWVGNLPFDATPDTVGEVFAEYGTLNGIRLPTDRETGEPKGFGYVEYSSVEEAKEAFNNLKGFDFHGRPLRLDFSTPRANNTDSPRGGRGGRGGGRGGFGDRGGRGGGRGGFGSRGGRGGARGGRGGSTNRGGFGDFQGKKVTF